MNSKRMTALAPYSNGNIGWPAGFSANWPEGEERILPDNVYEQIMRDGAGSFDVKFYTPPQAPEVPELPTQPAEPAPAPKKAKAPRAAKKHKDSDHA